ncbi:MAG: DUF507 family protein [Campylobacterales bacterium]|nr:DUF507 family protein [Campylobacterales bacterium]
MKLRKQHSPYISRKITKDLVNADFVEIRKEKASIEAVCQEILNTDIQKEIDLDEAVSNILESQEEQIEFYKADYRQLFWMTKKRLANEYGVNLNYEDRYSNIAHAIMDYLYEEDFIHFEVSDNQVKNIIANSISDYMKGYDEADALAYEKIKNYKRKLIPGTEEYDIVFNRLYEEELVRKGLL